MFTACENPIFVIGTERSGSNLLRLILNSHSHVAIPHPPHIMKYFAALEPYYGDLEVDANFRALIDDVLAHVAGHIHPWPNLPSADSLMNHAVRDLFGLNTALHENFLATTGKVRWGCKSTFMIHHVSRVRARYPRARFLWLVRDPRDVALSSRDSVFNPYHPYFTASLWFEQQSIGLALCESDAEHIQRIRYEDLVREPERVVKQICEFLDLSVERSMFRYFDTMEARTASDLATDWANLRRPIQVERAQRYAREISTGHLHIVEAVAAPLMQKLGYELNRPPQLAYRPSQLARFSYRVANEARRMVVEYRSLRHNRNHARRWRRALRLASLRTRLKLEYWVTRAVADRHALSHPGTTQDSSGTP